MIFRNRTYHDATTCPWWWDASLWAYDRLTMMQDSVNDGFENMKDVLWKYAHIDATDDIPDEHRIRENGEERDTLNTALKVAVDVLTAVDAARWLIKQRDGSSVQVSDR